MITVYLAHALTGAPEEFRERMIYLRQQLNSILGVQVLEFNWIPGKGPDLTLNTYDHDMEKVRQADLMIGILDLPSIGLGMEIQERCRIAKPMHLYYRAPTSVSRIVTDCVSRYRDSIGPKSDLPEPRSYNATSEIVQAVRMWKEFRFPEFVS